QAQRAALPKALIPFLFESENSKPRLNISAPTKPAMENIPGPYRSAKSPSEPKRRSPIPEIKSVPQIAVQYDAMDVARRAVMIHAEERWYFSQTRIIAAMPKKTPTSGV